MADVVDVPVDALVQSFLSAARSKGAGALVVYSYVEAGKPVLRMASNSDEQGTRAILGWLQKTDDATIEAAAQAVHESLKFIPGPWATVPSGIKDKLRAGIKVALQIIRDRSGKTLNVVDSDKPLVIS